MTQFPVLVLIAWIPICALLFALLKPARACTLAFVIGWLALPMAKVKLPGIPDIDKVSATSLGVVLGTALFRTNHFRGFHLGFGELLVVLFAASTFQTSIENELGPYDGLSSMLDKLLWYGVPYVCGRAYIRTRADFRESAQLIIVASAIYAIPALYEWRMSPQLHNMVYGFGQQSFNLSQRWGFYRPIVCFPANLALGGFFGWTAMLAFYMYQTRELKPFLRLPTLLLVSGPIGGLLISMSFGPWALFAAGMAMVRVWQKSAQRMVVLMAPLFAVIWMTTRYTNMVDGKWLTNLAAEVSPQRAASLQYRIDAETMFIEKSKAPGHEWFGWGGWGRNRIRDESGKDIVAIDGLWLIMLSTFGLSGLILFYLWWTYPVLLALRAGQSLDRDSLLMVILVGVGSQAVNFLFNAFLDPLLVLLVGSCAYQIEMSRQTRTLHPTMGAASESAAYGALSGGNVS